MSIDNRIVTRIINNVGNTRDVESHHEVTVDVPGAYEVNFVSKLLWLYSADQTCLQLPKPHTIWGFKIWAYSHPRGQAMMLGSVLFMTVGMFNVIIFIGGARQQTAWLSDIANIALYTVFSAFCFVTPTCLNYFGLRVTLCAGGVGYAAYLASLWCFKHTGNVPFVIFGGCWCGLSAALLNYFSTLSKTLVMISIVGGGR